MEGMAWKFVCWCILTTCRTDEILVFLCWFSFWWCPFELVRQVVFGVSMQALSGEGLLEFWRSRNSWNQTRGSSHSCVEYWPVVNFEIEDMITVSMRMQIRCFYFVKIQPHWHSTQLRNLVQDNQLGSTIYSVRQVYMLVQGALTWANICTHPTDYLVIEIHIDLRHSF